MSFIILFVSILLITTTFVIATDSHVNQSFSEALETLKLKQFHSTKTLPISLRNFYDLFYADQAANDLSKFYHEQLYSKTSEELWERNDDLNLPTPKGLHWMTRKLYFTKPIIYPGISASPCTNYQQLLMAPNVGMIIYSSTSMKGVPAADCFTMLNRVVVFVNPSNSQEITLEFSWELNFFKRSMFYYLIETNAFFEMKKYFVDYYDYFSRHVPVVSAIKVSSHSANQLPVTQDDASSSQDAASESRTQLSLSPSLSPTPVTTSASPSEEALPLKDDEFALRLSQTELSTFSFNISLPISLDRFHSLFVAPGAPYDLPMFYLGKKYYNLTHSPWQPPVPATLTPAMLTRQIVFTKSISYPGLSSTLCTNSQRVWYWPAQGGLIVYSSTRMRDVPAADSFTVEHRLVVTKATHGDGRDQGLVWIHGSFHVAFHKWSMLSSFITSTTTREMHQFFQEYFEFFSSHADAATDVVTASAVPASASSSSSTRSTQAGESTGHPAEVKGGTSNAISSSHTDSGSAMNNVAGDIARIPTPLPLGKASLQHGSSPLGAIRAWDRTIRRLLGALARWISLLNVQTLFSRRSQ